MVVAIGAFALGSATSDDGADTTAVVIPRSPDVADVYVPAELARVSTEIAAAYRDVFGPATDEAKMAAIQLGPELVPLLHRSARSRQPLRLHRRSDRPQRDHGGLLSFIDATHAIVRFSITIPGHGTLVRDRVGYAVQTDGSGRSRRAPCATSCGPVPRRRHALARAPA